MLIHTTQAEHFMIILSCLSNKYSIRWFPTNGVEVKMANCTFALSSKPQMCVCFVLFFVVVLQNTPRNVLVCRTCSRIICLVYANGIFCILAYLLPWQRSPLKLLNRKDSGSLANHLRTIFLFLVFGC